MGLKNGSHSENHLDKRRLQNQSGTYVARRQCKWTSFQTWGNSGQFSDARSCDGVIHDESSQLQLSIDPSTRSCMNRSGSYSESRAATRCGTRCLNAGRIDSEQGFARRAAIHQADRATISKSKPPAVGSQRVYSRSIEINSFGRCQ